MNRVKFDVKTSNENTICGIELTGFPKEKVRYTQKTEEGTNNFEVDWKDRFNQKVIKATLGDADAQMSFAKTVGFERVKYIDEKDGNKEKERTVRKSLTDFDAAAEMIKKKGEGVIGDGTPIYVSGKVAPNSWVDSDGTLKRSVKLQPDTITVTAPINLDELDEEAERKSAVFNSEIVVKEFNEINGEIYMTGILVGYDYIEEVEFKFDKPEVAETFKRNLKPYTMIKCMGVIKQEVQEEEVVVDKSQSCWGNAEDYSTKRTGRTKMVWKIGVGDPNTIDEESYSEAKVEEAKLALKAWKEDYKAGKEREEIKKESVPMDDFGDSAEWDDSEFD